MSRPEHLRCINTPEGIRRINELQELYDRDPQKYERLERERREEQQREEYEIRGQGFYGNNITELLAQMWLYLKNQNLL